MASRTTNQAAERRPETAAAVPARESVSLIEISQALSFWINKMPTVDCALCKPASRLGDVLGEMIYERAEHFPVSRIKPETLAHIEEALTH